MGLPNNAWMPNRKHLFALAYGMDAVIPMEVGMLTAHTIVQGQMNEGQELKRYLDWANEVGTLVLRKVFENTIEKGVEKLQANWEGPYIVSKVGESTAYHLQKLDGTPLLQPWNVSNLRQYYHNGSRGSTSRLPASSTPPPTPSSWLQTRTEVPPSPSLVEHSPIQPPNTWPPWPHSSFSAWAASFSPSAIFKASASSVVAF
ncbi:hypothetical protein CK203_113695 [Vitis vinifera]|uniref:Uncharacterized protein n=1 Tax=Vitis vinifera TaxID=29760 RepID=A0A438CD93_VITVI|nr:hypothetical protein CK203_113695 [Vitis vinifera]